MGSLLQGGHLFYPAPKTAIFHPDKASMLTLLMAVSVAEVISGLHPELDVKIKWPNDVLVNGHKVCGILTEMGAEPDYIQYVVVGVGINANQTFFPDEIKDIATSLRIEKGEKVTGLRLYWGSWSILNIITGSLRSIWMCRLLWISMTDI